MLRVAEDQGDTLLGVSEVVERLGEIDITQSFDVTLEMVVAFVQQMKDTIVTVSAKGRQGQSDLMALQLKGMNERESLLGNRLLGRAQAKLPSLEADWPNLIKQAISSANGVFDDSSSRHREALEDQALALERVTCSKLSVLVGRAGTGKTSVLGALLSCESLKKDGILLLAPTGKARVKLSKSTQKDSMTIAQFLMLCKRYDTLRQRPLLEVTASEKYRKEKTIVIDESSMLNTEELYTVLDSLDLAHVQRFILVGDPNQLPPIGAGRPFADLVSKLEIDGADGRFGQALGKLNVEVRSRTGDSQSDTLRLASWYTRELQTVDADKVFGDLELGVEFNDLEICLWKNADELRVRLLEQMQKNLGLKHQNDTAGFNKTLGMVSVRHSDVEFHNSDFSEYFQILSPVRNHHYGVGELNRWIQGQFRGEQLRRAKKKLATVLGDEKIVLADKVIQIRNGYKDGWNLSSNRKNDSIYLANGEIGTVARDKNGYLNVIFNGRPAQSFGYNHRDFPMGTGDLELAYALSVHKSQGSEFNIVLFVIPKKM
ncbi:MULTISPECIES: ATP-dependent DNA helicase [unclassified Paenibacillus]|uniref:ATP-dependent DNA helicase n=1 Tax=unclassified Paenibacillus TaxID=185978 RepID=UPI0009CA096B|nr:MULTISPECIES: AAA family ATPase [unclassified Paenibacillus]SLK17379.1 AAA domain-containing protein [Paenibacillus sp. RU5A]SOC74738.1 AAA domain-containing protein [Paenibacillus sp. RU26A]SOC76869.1 AAA domain-containing protein [Paenibacillus sp. RU5M]